MIRAAPLAVLLTSTLATAAPLLATRASFAEGGYCQAYRCTLTGRESIAPDLLAYTSYSYRIGTGGTVTVLRDDQKRVLGATLTGVPFTGNLARDFTRAFVGLAFEPSQLASCARNATPGGAQLFTGRVNGAAVTVSCLRLQGRVLLSVDTERPQMH